MANDFARAEQAGKDYFHDHPDSTHTIATRFARKTYTVVLQRELFVAGWNDAFWSEQARVLKASRCKVEC
jgi:hypothetical protein